MTKETEEESKKKKKRKGIVKKHTRQLVRKPNGQPYKDGEKYVNHQGVTLTRRRCCAKARSTGKPCRRPAMDNGRCYVHGGANHIAPPLNQGLFSHGLYYDALMAGEEEKIAQIKKEIDSLDEEIVMAKLKLRRAHIAQKTWEEGLLEDEEKSKVTQKHQMGLEQTMPPAAVEREVGTGINADGERFGINKKKIVRKAVDFSHEIHILTNDIIRLIRAKAEMQMMTRGEEFREKLALELREFTSMAGESVPEFKETKEEIAT